MKFSQRMGLEPKELPLQLKSMSPELRSSIWNHVLRNTEKNHWELLLRTSYGRFFFLPEDDAPEPITYYTGFNVSPCREDLKEKFFKLQWNRVYDFMEFYVRFLLLFFQDDDWNKQREYQRHEGTLNAILERQSSGYRMIEGEFAPITDVTELGSLKNSIDSTTTRFESIRVQLKKAVDALSQKPNPDYHNCIKESINAVDGLVRTVTKIGAKGKFDKVMEKLAEIVEIHPAMKEGFKKLYNYTSDEGGVRHALLEESEVGLAEAKYMLVVCSAFVNFILMKLTEEAKK